MTDRALIVGIKYPTGGTFVPLPSSVREAEEWRNLLVDHYEFENDDIRLCVDDRASKPEIMQRLTWLLSSAKPGDRRIFVFCGHGMRVRRRDSAGDLFDLLDEAMVAYPLPGKDIVDAGIYDDELTELYCARSVPPGTLVTFVLDCCFSGGFDFAESLSLPDGRVLRRKSLTLPADLAHRARGLTTTSSADGDRKNLAIAFFGWRLTQSPDVACTRPVIVAACGESDVAREVTLDGVARSLFSFEAISALQKTPDLTHRALVDEVTPKLQFAAQRPAVTGDAKRISKPFFN